ncbi:MAG TPA: Sir2 family NAD-dependent protein deacetylase [Rhodospirillales bacterium]|jgi:NAD-dependent deacetylase|nr:Sir2 family NAD-dependent protein deacetylase [Rhodospirillales bacterium]HJO69647.1 Sir2 family NAD-dependent protein deacetylase [Rhodospirillales bacterium]
MQNESTDPSLEELRQALATARRAVVFTGAGISTESGIPDFRSPGGIWERTRPIDFHEFVESEDARREYWSRKFEGHEAITAAQPNRGHEAVAELVRRGTARVVITQNIDGLHQKAGVPDEHVIELHGNTTYAACLTCGAHHALEPIREAFLAGGALPVCRACGGIVKTATISFGQTMPVEAMGRAQDESQACDLFLCVGSSLVVFPAAGLPVIAKRGGARLVIVNRESTDLDAIADQVLNREIGETLARAVAGAEP